MTSRRLFLSYAREDRAKADAVAAGLRRLGTEVWLDESLSGGQRWWDAILGEIRDCELFVQCVSPAAADSEACSRERAYAAALGKPVLPVGVAPMAVQLLPADLVQLQIVDYTDPTSAEAALALGAAVINSPAAAPLPEPLPAPPPVPVS